MKVMHIALAALLAVGTAAAPAAGQDSVRARQLAQRSQARAIVRAQQAQRAQAQRTREQQQRLAREQAQRQRQQQEREQQRQRQEQQRNLWRSWPEATETFSRTIRLGRGGTFDLQHVAGNIVLEGGGGDDVRIDAIKRVRHRVEATARAALPEVRIDVIERGATVEVRTSQPRRGNFVSAVDYTVALPSGANVIVRTVSGDVQVTNINGELRAQSVSGNVTAASVRRVREVRSTSGTVDISDGESDELTAHTLSGDVLVRNLKARVLNLQTVTGDVRLSGVEVDRARLESMSGDLEYAGRLARSGRYEFQTHSGDIRVTPSGNPGFDFQARSFSGDVRSDYALKLLQGDSRRPNEALHGTVGDASAAVTAQSFSGDILILKR